VLIISDYIVANMTAEGCENVKKEPVTVSQLLYGDVYSLMKADDTVKS